ncbi:DUF3114 domain-containing protein [Paucilactobacillus hokkaidonensis]|uniref:DUF3114 domain-containing protein n=1 Tax=Paucilactobacillus hokkaidonensis TaxID=1193095 RepID=UPI001F3E94B7|nr:DUF3114 domain-containing protein [Paucilactobacillus hokkaidonensis]
MDNEHGLVGSPAYTSWMKQKIENDSTKDNCRNILIQMFNQLGAHLNSLGDLELPADFDSDLNPNSIFFSTLARIVQVAFPAGLAEGSIQDIKLRKMVHQLRYYLDVFNVSYLRRQYSDVENDRQRLILYDLDCYQNRQQMSHSEPARLHNKLDRQLKIPVMDGWNIKRVYDFHVEFILDRHGRFVYLDLQQLGKQLPGQIINCSSFNYADRNDDQHKKLDIHYNARKSPLSQSKDPGLRSSFNSHTYSPKKDNLANTIREIWFQLQFDLCRRWELLKRRIKN